MKTSELLEYVATGKQWALLGEPENALQYEQSLTWLSKGNAPSWQALKAAEPEAEYKKAYTAVEVTRQAEYVAKSDPLFFGWQRGENTEQEWLDAVQEIKDANPYPDKPAGVN